MTQHPRHGQPGTANTAGPGRRMVRRHPFSLVELLVGLMVIALVAFLLFRFFANMQKAYNASMNTTALAETARAAFDVMTTDLQTAVAAENDIPGKHIWFSQPTDSSLWFVATGEPSPAATSDLIEIGYRVTNDGRFQRAWVDNTNSNWNVYGNRDDASQQDGYHTVVNGVISLRFICYDGTLTVIPPGTPTRVLPRMVGIELKVMDPDKIGLWSAMSTTAMKAEIETKYSRSFRKTVYLATSTR